MEEAASQDGRKRRLTFEPASERGSDKRHRTCCHGGASTVETMTAAFKIIMGDPNVKSIFVNIFGGIARCDDIATAVVAGVLAVGGNDAVKPLVIRLEGTNVEAGMAIIKESGINAFLTNDFTTGAKKAVEL